MKTAACVLISVFLASATRAADLDWPEFRGPTQQGHSSSTNLPLTWSETEHVKFKTTIPGRGWSSPVIWGDQVWMTTALDQSHSMRAVCVDKNSGRIIHDVEVFHPQELQHTNAFNSLASPTPVIEKGRVYVSFGGYGSACLDTATGEPIWKSDELKIEHMEGPGSTPILYKDLYILQCDGVDTQFVAALDKMTGKLAWKTPRTTPFDFWIIGPFRKAFGTPIVIQADGKDQLISPAARRLYSYDPRTGTEFWHVDLEGRAYSTAPRPLFADGVVYACTGFEQAQLWAVKTQGASGDITKTHVLWKFKQGVPLRSSPILVDGLIYFTSDAGIARCVDARTGQQVWQNRIGPAYSASPIYADGRLYFFSERGQTTVLAPGREFKKLAENELGDGCLATPAISGSAFFIRTRTELYRVEQ
jgi:outer membrane protein assembly factor BamB